MHVLAIAVLATLLIAATPAAATTSYDGWGFAVADDDWEWDDPGYLPSLEDGFADLTPKTFRFQIIWNAADLPWHMDRARSLIARARAQGVQQIVVTFKKSVGPDVDPVYGSQPTAAGYAEHVGEVVRQLAADVDVWGPANEPNRGETWLPGVSGAQLLAQYQASFEQVVDTWDPTAETTSPDFVDRTDLGTIERYVRPYMNAGGGWGDHVAFHPYWGAHHESTQTTLDLVSLAPPGASVWLTEVGAFGRDQGNIEADETTQNDRVWWLATTLAALPQVERIHYYHMRGNPNASWDTGLLNVDGSPRIAWHTWCAAAHGDLGAPTCQPVTPRSAAPPPPPPPSTEPSPPPDPSPPIVPAPLPPPGSVEPMPTPGIGSAFAAPAGCPSPTVFGTCIAPVASPSPDLTRPTVTIDRLANRLTYRSFVDGFALRVRLNEPSSLQVGVAVRTGRVSDGRTRYVMVARKRLDATAGTRLVRLDPGQRPLQGKQRFVARVRVRATDQAGNWSVSVERVRVGKR